VIITNTWDVYQGFHMDKLETIPILQMNTDNILVTFPVTLAIW
jgi:hypothetical protein